GDGPPSPHPAASVPASTSRGGGGSPGRGRVSFLALRFSWTPLDAGQEGGNLLPVTEEKAPSACGAPGIHLFCLESPLCLTGLWRRGNSYLCTQLPPPWRCVMRTRSLTRRNRRPARQERPIRPWLEVLEDRVCPAVFTVTNLSPTGAGSFDAAVT